MCVPRPCIWHAHTKPFWQAKRLRLSHLKRDHARKLLALARASRDAARSDVISTGKHLKEVQKAAEVLRVRQAVAAMTLKEAEYQIGAIRGALDLLCISEISLSDDEDDRADDDVAFHDLDFHDSASDGSTCAHADSLTTKS